MRSFVVITLLAISAWGCSNSSSTDSSVTTLQSQVGATSTFAQNSRDTAKSNFDFDIARGFDTTIRTTFATNQFYMGKSNVTIYRDSSTRTHAVKLIYITQQSDQSIWIYNYGQDVWSVNRTGIAVPDIGWVKYKGSSTEGNWYNHFSGYLFNGINSTITYETEVKPDETITVSGKSYSAKHFLHTITATSPGNTFFFTIYLDSYLVYELGMPVKEVVHSYQDWEQNNYFGTTTQMIAHAG